MIAPDTSVLVAGFHPLHSHYEPATSALARIKDQGGRLVTQTIAEAYAALTIPAGAFQVRPEQAVEYLGQFDDLGEPVGLEPADYRAACGVLAEASIPGHAIYDALIALAARRADLTLLTLDRRARPTYEACGARFELLSQ